MIKKELNEFSYDRSAVVIEKGRFLSANKRVKFCQVSNFYFHVSECILIRLNKLITQFVVVFTLVANMGTKQERAFSFLAYGKQLQNLNRCRLKVFFVW